MTQSASSPVSSVDQAIVGAMTRRHFLGRTTCSFGAAALAGLLNDQAASALAGSLTHHAPTAKRIIYLHMAGSPPHHDLFDYKPLLNQRHGEVAPQDCYADRSAFVKPNATVLGSPYAFEQVGGNGAWVSELLPHFKSIVDDVCIVRSMHTDQFNHAPAQLLLHTGHMLQGRPSMGSWLSWGLGSENEDLPAFLVLVSGGKKPSAGTAAWSSGFMPTVHGGVQCRSKGDPVLGVGDPAGMDRALRRKTIDAINAINQLQADEFGDPETLSRIEQYELAFRMQTSVPEVMDISQEPASVLEAYGADPGTSSLANNCLLARRLSEAGVRFVQLFDWGWDVHGTNPSDDLMNQLPMKCQQMDRPVAALIKDLKQRGLLEDTLVIWSGEFGRTVMNEKRNGSTHLGRDHYPSCFTIWMAGGGIKAGTVHGSTDDWGAHVHEHPVSVHDLQATVLHTMGFDHEHLRYRSQGRDFRLTDVHGHVQHALLA
ncbi:MAG: DUF1501 domain-containing protein [Phycisphaerales bacterium]|nr:DUF1501 domain-containing protein [Phycisphaerales bacterium]